MNKNNYYSDKCSRGIGAKTLNGLITISLLGLICKTLILLSLKNSHYIWLLTIVFFFHLPLYGQVWNYDVPGGSEFSSPDYTVTIEQDGVTHPSFVHYSFPLDEYYRYHTWDKKLFAHKVHPPEKRNIVSHSTAIFSLKGKITVRVTIKPDAENITLPLSSARND